MKQFNFTICWLFSTAEKDGKEERRAYTHLKEHVSTIKKKRRYEILEIYIKESVKVTPILLSSARTQ